MRDRFPATGVLEILALDVDPNSFYDVFFSEADSRGFDLPALDEEADLGRDQDVVRAVCALSLRAIKNEHYGGSRAEMCRYWEISKDKAYRLNKFLRNADMFGSQTKNVYDGCERFISYHREEEEMMVEVLEKEAPEEPYEETIRVDKDGNEASVTASATMIDTVDDLVEQAGFDPDKWRSTIGKAKSYQQGLKLREILKFKENGDPIYTERKDKQQLYSYHLNLERKEMKPVRFEPLDRVEVNVSQQYEPRSVETDSDLRTALFVSDPQIGFKRDTHTAELTPIHDRRAMDVTLQVAAHIDPDDIIILGDWLDMTGWTKKYTTSQEFRETTQPSLAEGQWWLKQFDIQHPMAEKHYLKGNHEDRLQDAVLNHLEAAAGVTPGGRLDEAPLMSIERFLELEKMGYEVSDPYPHGEVWLNDALKAIHGESAAKTVHRKLVENHNVSVVQGHNHRIGKKSGLMQYRDNQQPIFGVTAGCMCRTDPGVVPAVNNRMNWQQGLATAQYDPSGLTHDVETTRIHNGTAVFRGQKFSANPMLDSLRAGTDYGSRLKAAFPEMV